MSQVVPIQPITPYSTHDAVKNFYAVFPPPQTAGIVPNYYQLAKFHAWGVMHGYLPHSCEPATLSALSNALRNKIHKHALSQGWTDLGYTAFTVRATQAGGFIAVDLPLPTFDVMAPQMPGKMLKAVETKKGNVFKVLAGIDKTKLGPVDLARVEHVEGHIDSVFKNMQFVIAMCNGEILRTLKMLPPSYITQYLPHNVGVATVPNEDEVNDNEPEAAEEEPVKEDQLNYDVMEEADHIAAILKAGGFKGDGLELVLACEKASRFNLSTEGGFAPEEIAELIQQVRIRLDEPEDEAG